MIRRGVVLPDKELADILGNSKLKPEKFEDAVLAESGDVDDVDAVDGDGEDGPNAVLRRRSEFLGWSGWNLDGIVKKNCYIVSCIREFVIA